MTTREEMDAMIAFLQSTFPNFHPREGTAEAYYQLLSDLSLDELRAAVLEFAGQDREFAPAPGQIRAAVMNLRRLAMGVPSAIEAWGEVWQQITTRGHNHAPEFSNPMIAALVDRFGWRELCQSENAVADRAHFIKAYEAAVEQELRADMRLPAVQKYIAARQPKQIEVRAGVKQLAERMAR